MVVTVGLTWRICWVIEWSGGKEGRWERGGRDTYTSGLERTAAGIRRDSGTTLCRVQGVVGEGSMRVCEAAIGLLRW
jgi:hypothetical protein